MKPSYWSLPSDHGTHLTVLLPQPTLLSCHKFEQFQYLAENRNKANHCWFCWAWKLPHNDNLIQSEIFTEWKQYILRLGPICLKFYFGDMILHLPWCHMRMSQASQHNYNTAPMCLRSMIWQFLRDFTFIIVTLGGVRLSRDLSYPFSRHR